MSGTAAAVADALTRGPDVSVTCLPDGSVDRRYAVADAAGDVEARAALGQRIATGDAKSFLVDHEGTDAGGQAVNAARQAHAIGAETALYGHLDHEVFDGLPFETRSMGRPADVAVLEFADDAVLFTEESPDVAGWGLDDLCAVAGDAGPFKADAVVWTNWASTADGTAALRAYARACDDGAARADGWLVVDPGDVTLRDPAAVGPFLDALAVIDGDVALSVNTAELAFLADAVSSDPPADESGRLGLLRERGDLGLAVLHGEDAAVARDAAGTTRCPNRAIEARRYAGGGDRFSAGLAYALAAGWPLEQALTLANACATYYVAHAETAGPERLAAWLDG